MGACLPERLLPGFGRINDGTYTDVDVGERTTGLPGAAFDQLQSPLDMFRMHAEEYDAVGHLSGQSAGSGTLHRHVDRQRRPRPGPRRRGLRKARRWWPSRLQ